MDKRPKPGTDKVLKVLVLGDGNVGKTSVINRYVNNTFDPHSLHTVGVEFLKKHVIVDGTPVLLQLWDTAGQERFRSLRTPFYRGTDICLLMFSFTDPISFQNLNYWLSEFCHHADIPDPSHFPLILVGNKVDLRGSIISTNVSVTDDKCTTTWSDASEKLPPDCNGDASTQEFQRSDYAQQHSCKLNAVKVDAKHPPSVAISDAMVAEWAHEALGVDMSNASSVYIQTSAKTSANVAQAFELAIHSVSDLDGSKRNGASGDSQQTDKGIIKMIKLVPAQRNRRRCC